MQQLLRNVAVLEFIQMLRSGQLLSYRKRTGIVLVSCLTGTIPDKSYSMEEFIF